MAFPIQVDTKRMGLSNLYFKGSKIKSHKLLEISAFDCNFFIITNSADPDDIQLVLCSIHQHVH